jgi:hypothetical protein
MLIAQNEEGRARSRQGDIHAANIGQKANAFVGRSSTNAGQDNDIFLLTLKAVTVPLCR